MKFLGRLDRLFDHIIGLDTFLSNGKFRQPTLKDIIDNLRSYTVIASIWVATKFLWKDSNALSGYAAILLLLIIYFLTVLVAAQSAFIIFISTGGWISALIPPRLAVKIRRSIRKNEKQMKIILFILMFPILFSTWALASGLLNVLTKADLL